MGRINQITVSLDLTLQPAAYQSVKLGLTVTEVFGEQDFVDSNYGVVEKTAALRKNVSDMLRVGIYQEIEDIYGKETADYCLQQAADKLRKMGGS